MAKQDERFIKPLSTRQRQIPPASFSMSALPRNMQKDLLMGLFMNIAGLTTLALVFFSFSVLFQLVTLPVEIDASRRAVAYIEQSGMSSKQVNGAKKVLTAAALTYVAAALTSIIQLLYLMARYNRNSNR